LRRNPTNKNVSDNREFGGWNEGYEGYEGLDMQHDFSESVLPARVQVQAGLAKDEKAKGHSFASRG